MPKAVRALALCLLLSACADADGSRPRLGPAAELGAGPAFNGGYAGANGGMGNLATKSTAF